MLNLFFNILMQTDFDLAIHNLSKLSLLEYRYKTFSKNDKTLLQKHVLVTSASLRVQAGVHNVVTIKISY